MLWPCSSYIPWDGINSWLGVRKSTRALQYSIPQYLAPRGGGLGPGAAGSGPGEVELRASQSGKVELRASLSGERRGGHPDEPCCQPTRMQSSLRRSGLVEKQTHQGLSFNHRPRPPYKASYKAAATLDSSDSFFWSSSEIFVLACCRSSHCTQGMVSNVVVVSLAVALTSSSSDHFPKRTVFLLYYVNGNLSKTNC